MRTKEKTYFQILAELAPKEFWNIDKKEPYYSDFADIERVRELGANLYDEIKYFRADLMNKQPQDRITIIEYTIRELLFSYETVRLAMKQLPDPERDTGRASMLLLSRAITGIISMTEYDLKLKFTDDIVDYWERRQINRLLGELKELKEDKKQMDLSQLDNIFNPKRMDDKKLNELKDDLKEFVPNYDKMQISALASVIYDSDILHKNAKPKYFKHWLKQFCNILGVEKSNYKPSSIKIQEKEKMKNTYYYLFE